MTDKDRQILLKFFQRHPHPPWIVGPNVEQYYPGWTKDEE